MLQMPEVNQSPVITGVFRPIDLDINCTDVKRTVCVRSMLV